MHLARQDAAVLTGQMHCMVQGLTRGLGAIHGDHEMSEHVTDGRGGHPVGITPLASPGVMWS